MGGNPAIRVDGIAAPVEFAVPLLVEGLHPVFLKDLFSLSLCGNNTALDAVKILLDKIATLPMLSAFFGTRFLFK